MSLVIYFSCFSEYSYMHVRVDNLRALASGLSLICRQPLYNYFIPPTKV